MNRHNKVLSFGETFLYFHGKSKKSGVFVDTPNDTNEDVNLKTKNDSVKRKIEGWGN